jgi:D-alanyl-D-alanine carboxypeptidase
VTFGHSAAFRAPLAFALAVSVLAALPADRASAHSMLLIEADTGRILHNENGAHPWYPASVTKVMTAYVTLKAVKAGRISLDTLITVSPNAAAQAPTKMGFKVGSQITIDNALKTIMVKSANDMSVTLAEGVSGSIAAFAEEMNKAAARLGMTQTTYVNPNGLPADEQVTSARDQAILARAIYNELPEYHDYWNISAIKYGKRIMRNYNTLLGRYPGTDGLKTGFICASGFNVVVSAKRNGRRLIAVMLGAPSGSARAVKVAQMLERGFSAGGFSWLTPSMGTVDTLQPINAAPPNLREEICGKKRKRPARESEDLEDEAEASLPPGIDPNSPQAVMLSSLRGSTNKPAALLGDYNPTTPTVEVFLGATKGSVPVQEPQVAGKKSKKKKNVATTPAAPAPAAGGGTLAQPAPATRGTLAPAQGFAATPNAPRPGAFTPSSAAAGQPAAKPAAKSAAPKTAAAPAPAASGTQAAAPQQPAKKKAAKKKPDPTAEATAKPPAPKPAQPAAR